MGDLRNICSECKNQFPPSELVECPVCSGRLVISQKPEPPPPQPDKEPKSDPDLSEGEGDLTGLADILEELEEDLSVPGAEEPTA